MVKGAGGSLNPPLTTDEIERYLGGNVFAIEILFDGDFAALHPFCREIWNLRMVEEWLKNGW